MSSKKDKRAKLAKKAAKASRSSRATDLDLSASAPTSPADWSMFDDGDDLADAPDTLSALAADDDNSRGMPESSALKSGWANRSPEERTAHARLLGYSSAASLTPEQRTARARKAGLASAANRRARREAEGAPDPRPRSASKPQPTLDELDPYIELLLKEDPSRVWTHTQLRAQAIAEMKRDIALVTYRNARKNGAK
jgi:hypothetical protein